jgi:diamine N-acetyltransferase
VKAVQLIVRRNNLRAQQLYLQEHFTATGECVKDVLGKPVEFFTMAIDRRTFFLGNRS